MGIDAMVGILTPRFCFPPGTVVWVVDADGKVVLKVIEEVEEDEYVLSYNHETGEWEACRVLLTHENDYDGAMLDMSFVIDGMGPLMETVSATGSHPFWVVAGENLPGRAFPLFEGPKKGQSLFIKLFSISVTPFAVILSPHRWTGKTETGVWNLVRSTFAGPALPSATPAGPE